MISVLAVLHVFICVFIIVVIMIQDPKGGSSGLFSGGSNSLIGASGSADFLTKLTRYTGIIFGVLCIALTIVTKPSSSGVFSKVGVPAATEAQAPGAQPAAQPAAAAEPVTPAGGAVAPTSNQVPAPGGPGPEEKK